MFALAAVRASRAESAGGASRKSIDLVDAAAREGGSGLQATNYDCDFLEVQACPPLLQARPPLATTALRAAQGNFRTIVFGTHFQRRGAGGRQRLPHGPQNKKTVPKRGGSMFVIAMLFGRRWCSTGSAGEESLISHWSCSILLLAPTFELWQALKTEGDRSAIPPYCLLLQSDLQSSLSDRRTNRHRT
jgi:hypothetical protein